MFKNYRIRDYGFKLLIYCIILGFCGVIMVGSAKESLQNKQGIGFLIGVFVMIIVSLIDYNLIAKFYWVIYVLNIGLLSLTLTPLGHTVSGSARWIEIFGFRFQPSDTAKILLILFFAQFIMVNKNKVKNFKFVLMSVVLLSVPWFLIYKQPDLSTSIAVFVVVCIILFVGGIDYRVVIGVIAVAVPVFIIAFNLVLQPNQSIIEDYQQRRILAFVDPENYPDDALQQMNSVTAIASGQLDGKGYKNNEISSLKNGNFIIEPQTDFIFAVLGEEFGFKGGVFVIVLLYLTSFECIKIARRAKDTCGSMIATGVGSLIAVQSFFNIGVNTFLLPNTGIPLPFVSYGLTSLLSMYIGIGLVLNVKLQCIRGKVNNNIM